MTNEITTTAPADRDRSELAEMFAGLLQLAKDPDVQPEKMKALADLQISMMEAKREDERQRRVSEFRTAKIAAIREMPFIAKDGAIKNKAGQVQSRYSNFETIYATIRPILESHGLALSFDQKELEGGRIGVASVLSHVNGEFEVSGYMPLHLDSSGSKNPTQGAGSSLAYGKRHTMKSHLNIVEHNEDADGAPRKALDEGSKWADLEADARSAAKDGTEAYVKWFGDRTNMERGYLVDQGTHSDCKKMAANFDPD